MATQLTSEAPTFRFFSRLRSFWFGVTLPLSALKLILSRPTLMMLSLIPMLITVALYFWIVKSLQGHAQFFIQSLFERQGWEIPGWATTLLQWITQIVLWLVAALTFSFTTSIVSSPFNDFLAERTEKFAVPALPAVVSGTFLFQLRLISIDLAKSVAAGIATIIALLFSWIPVINFFSFIIAFLLVCFQYVSYPQTRRQIGLKPGLAFLWRHFYACLGFGCSIAFLFAIPLLSVVALPLAVVGGTLLFARAQTGLK